MTENCRPDFRKATIAMLLAAVAAPAYAVTATDVVCTQCVDTTDIKAGAVKEFKLAPNSVSTFKIQKNAVTTTKIAPNSITEWKLKTDAVSNSKIQDGAVTTDKIADGAVTYDKLDADLQEAVDSTSSIDFNDYSSGAVTQKVFAMSGDFGPCTGSVSAPPDTQVEDIVRTDLGGGVTQIVTTSWRYAGGATGTPCRKDVNTYIRDADTHRFVAYQRYQSNGTTLVRDVDLGYDAVTDPDEGLVLLTSDMRKGIDFASAGITTESVGGETGAFISEMVLIDSGFSETIDEGGPNEETFSNCFDTIEDRTSKHLGTRARIRTFCPGVGNVMRGQVETGNGNSFIWELVDYTVADPS